MVNHAHGGISDVSGGHAIFFGDWIDRLARGGDLSTLPGVFDGSGFYAKT
jgi:hypothetical protein